MRPTPGNCSPWPSSSTSGHIWYGRRDRDGPAYWDLVNYLGDRGATPKSLERGRPPAAVGPVALQYVKLAPDAAPALEVAYQGQRVLLLPPVRGLAAEALPAVAGSLEALVLPAELATSEDRNHIMARLKPRRVVVYGDPGRSARGPVSLARALPVHPGGGGEPLPGRLRGNRPAVAAARVSDLTGLFRSQSGALARLTEARRDLMVQSGFSERDIQKSSA